MIVVYVAHYVNHASN